LSRATSSARSRRFFAMSADSSPRRTSTTQYAYFPKFSRIWKGPRLGLRDTYRLESYIAEGTSKRMWSRCRRRYPACVG